MESLQSEISIF